MQQKEALSEYYTAVRRADTRRHVYFDHADDVVLSPYYLVPVDSSCASGDCAKRQLLCRYPQVAPRTAVTRVAREEV